MTAQRVRLLPAQMQNGLARRPLVFEFPVQGINAYWCMGCGATIRVGDWHARGTSSGRICFACVETAEHLELDNQTKRLPRLRGNTELQPERDRRTEVTIRWEDTVTGEDVRRLSKAWAAKISEKPVVTEVHVRTVDTDGDVDDHVTTYEAFLAVRTDGSVVKVEDPVSCAHCGKAHFSRRAADKCSRRLVELATSPD